MRIIYAFLLILGMWAGDAEARRPCVLGKDVPETIPVSGTVFVAFLKPQCFGIYVHGRLASLNQRELFFGWTSTGADGMETPITLPQYGPHRIWKKKRIHFSKEVTVWVRGREVRAVMPYAWFFDDKGRAVHQGNPRQPRASHGCVRLPPWAARALFYRFSLHELRVIISPHKEDLAIRWAGWKQ